MESPFPSTHWRTLAAGAEGGMGHLSSSRRADDGRNGRLRYNRPVSAAAFSVATDAAVVGNTALMTTFGLCFAATGWIPLFAWLLHLITKKGPRFDGDDANLAMSGPINAFFDNMKLTVIFAAPYACRDPFRVIPCYLLTCSLTGLFSGAAGLANSLYTAPEKSRYF